MRHAVIALLAAGPLLGSCTGAPSAACQQLAGAMPLVTSFSLAMFLGLVSAANSGLGGGLGVLMAAYTGWIDSTNSLQAGCGVGFCRIAATVCGTFMDWFSGSIYGYALKSAAPWIQLAGGAFVGAFSFIWALNLVTQSC